MNQCFKKEIAIKWYIACNYFLYENDAPLNLMMHLMKFLQEKLYKTII